MLRSMKDDSGAPLPKSAEPLRERGETIFDAARQLPVEQRAAYLNQACADDVQLRQQVEILLKAHESAGDFLEEPPASSPKKTIILSVPLTEKPGDKIGRYKLLQQIGEGGCGVVYMAEQEEPLRRRVALKIIKLGMDTRSVIARFEAERQALAMMDHPNIAKVFDAGATESALTHPPGTLSSTGGDGRGEGGICRIANRKSQIANSRRPSLLRHGTGARDQDHRILPREKSLDTAAAGPVHESLSGDP